MNQTILIIWNEGWACQIDAFKINRVPFDLYVGYNFGCSFDSYRHIFYNYRSFWNDQSNEEVKSVATYVSNIIKKNNYDYIFPTFVDKYIEYWAYQNEKFNLKGIKPSSAQHLKSKNRYYKILKEQEISVPVIYGIIEEYKNIKNLQFPLICKPIQGTGSEGIKICFDNKDLETFLNDNQEFFPYIIQEYIEGTTVCVIGHIVNGRTVIDLIYDIETSSSPYCVETGFTFPSKFNYIEKLIQKDIDRFAKFIGLDDSPFMLDVIIDKQGKYFFIDFGARISVSIYRLMYYLDNADYFYNLANRILNGIDFSVKKEKSYICRHIILNSGQIKSITYKNLEGIVDYNLPKVGDIIIECKNDFDTALQNYFVISVGDSIEEAELNYIDFKNSIEVVYQS